MEKKSDEQYCSMYISPEERRLLARIACRRGVGRDYLALTTLPRADSSGGRPIPQWLGGRAAPQPAPAPAQRKPRAAPQARHCRRCQRLVAVDAAESQRFVCAARVWTQPLRLQSLRSSLRLRLLSLLCDQYQERTQPTHEPPHHCRACRELVEADTTDERYVCSRDIWTNAMKPQSVANARRLTRLSATCPFFAARPGRWIPRTRSRRAGDG